MIEPVYGRAQEVGRFVAANIPGETGFHNYNAIGFGTPLVAGASQVGASLVTDGWTAGATVLAVGKFSV